MDWRERIESDPKTLRGEPRVRGTEVPVSDVLHEFAARLDFRDVLKNHPGLSEDDVRACLAWAADASHVAERAPAGVGINLGDATWAVNDDAAKKETFAKLVRGMRTLVGVEMESSGPLVDIVLVYDGVRDEIEVKHLIAHGEMTELRTVAVGSAWKKKTATVCAELLRSVPHHGGGTELAARDARTRSVVEPAEGQEAGSVAHAPGAPVQGEPMLYHIWLRGPAFSEASDSEQSHPEAPATQVAPAGTAKGFKEFLRSMPNVGEDADFERPLDYGRPDIEWDI